MCSLSSYISVLLVGEYFCVVFFCKSLWQKWRRIFSTGGKNHDIFQQNNWKKPIWNKKQGDTTLGPQWHLVFRQWMWYSLGEGSQGSCQTNAVRASEGTVCYCRSISEDRDWKLTPRHQSSSLPQGIVQHTIVLRMGSGRSEEMRGGESPVTIFLPLPLLPYCTVFWFSCKIGLNFCWAAIAQDREARCQKDMFPQNPQICTVKGIKG